MISRNPSEEVVGITGIQNGVQTILYKRKFTKMVSVLKFIPKEKSNNFQLILIPE